MSEDPGAVVDRRAPGRVPWRRLRPTCPISPLVPVCLIVCAIGCAGTQGYEGDRRPASEVATVIGEYELLSGFGRAAVVSIESIDGAERRGRWKRGTAEVDLPPGSYELLFSVDLGTSPFAPEATEDNGRARRVRMDLAAAYDYHVWFDHEDGYFFMLEALDSGDDREEPPPPGSRARCRLALTEVDRASCETAMKARP